MSAHDCYRIAAAALCMTGAAPNPRERSVAHFVRISDGPALRAALAALPFVAHGVHREPGEWQAEEEAAAVLAAAARRDEGEEG
jgi:hypothetical protein